MKTSWCCLAFLGLWFICDWTTAYPYYFRARAPMDNVLMPYYFDRSDAKNLDDVPVDFNFAFLKDLGDGPDDFDPKYLNNFDEDSDEFDLNYLQNLGNNSSAFRLNYLDNFVAVPYYFDPTFLSNSDEDLRVETDLSSGFFGGHAGFYHNDVQPPALGEPTDVNADNKDDLSEEDQNDEEGAALEEENDSTDLEDTEPPAKAPTRRKRQTLAQQLSLSHTDKNGRDRKVGQLYWDLNGSGSYKNRGHYGVGYEAGLGSVLARSRNGRHSFGVSVSGSGYMMRRRPYRFGSLRPRNLQYGVGYRYRFR